MSTRPYEDGLEKIHYQYGQEELIRACGGEMTQFFFEGENIKSAASDIFSRSKLASLRPPKGKFGVHCVIVGAQEQYGPNRNADGFPGESLRKYGSTFVTHGHMFREHRNRDKKLAIGEIKEAAYHPDLHRTELFLWGDCDKAPEEYARAREGKQASYSMSCKVPYDICSCCEKKSATTRDYCSHLRDNMLQFLPSFGKYAFAINDKPTFFDASDVGRPADRIAHGLEYLFNEDMAKAASAEGRIIGGAEMARWAGVNLPAGGAVPFEKMALIRNLATYELLLKERASTNEFSKFASNVADYAWRPFNIPATKMATLKKVEVGTFFHEMAKRACLLSFPAFLSYTCTEFGEEEKAMAKYAHSLLPDTFKKLAAQLDSSEGMIPGADSFDQGSSFLADVDPGNSDDVQQAMDYMIDEAGTDPQQVQGRAAQNVVEGVPPGDDNIDAELSLDLQKKAEFYVSMYGLYKASALMDIQSHRPDANPLFLAALAVAQNR